MHFLILFLLIGCGSVGSETYDEKNLKIDSSQLSEKLFSALKEQSKVAAYKEKEKSWETLFAELITCKKEGETYNCDLEKKYWEESKSGLVTKKNVESYSAVSQVYHNLKAAPKEINCGYKKRIAVYNIVNDETFKEITFECILPKGKTEVKPYCEYKTREVKKSQLEKAINDILDPAYGPCVLPNH